MLSRLIFLEGPQPEGAAKPQAELASAGRRSIRPPAVPARTKGRQKRGVTARQSKPSAGTEVGGSRSRGGKLLPLPPPAAGSFLVSLQMPREPGSQGKGVGFWGKPRKLRLIVLFLWGTANPQGG